MNEDGEMDFEKGDNSLRHSDAKSPLMAPSGKLFAHAKSGSGGMRGGSGGITAKPLRPALAAGREAGSPGCAEPLVLSDSRYRRLLESVTSYIYTVVAEKGQSVATRHGEGCLSVTGFAPQDYEQDGGLWYRMIHPDDQMKVVDMIQAVYAGSGPVSMIHRILHKDGSIRWIRNAIVPQYDEAGELVFYDGIVNDITERKSVEEAVKVSERNLRDIMENSHDLILSVDRKGRLLAANASLLQAVAELNGGRELRVGDNLAPDDISEEWYSRWRPLMERAFAGERFETSMSIEMAGGRRYLEVVFNPILSGDGRAESVGIFIHDTTERTLAQGAFEAMVRSIADKTGLASFDAIAANLEEWLGVDAILVAEFTQDFAGLHALASRMGGRPLPSALYPIDDLPCRRVGTTHICLHSLNAPLILSETGTPGPPLENHLGIPIKNSQGEAIGVICAMARRPIKVTETVVEMMEVLAGKAAAELERAGFEKTLRASLDEKVALLREVHHRVKNNLQIITSLIYLQRSFLKSDKISVELVEMGDRIYSMALVHEALYATGRVEQVELAEYVDSLCDHLWTSHYPVGRRPIFRKRICEAALGLDQAVPCGIIINELVTNALLHAFPEGREGTITVEAEKEAGILRLVIGDDGVGLPEAQSRGSLPTLGLTLVSELTRQLGGWLRVEKDHGIRYTLEFPIQGENRGE
jgi:PAS domain S-box-containing protein